MGLPAIVTGGVLGFLVAGPLGAAVGAGVGHVLTKPEGRRRTDIVGDIRRKVRRTLGK